MITIEVPFYLAADKARELADRIPEISLEVMNEVMPELEHSLRINCPRPALAPYILHDIETLPGKVRGKIISAHPDGIRPFIGIEFGRKGGTLRGIFIIRKPLGETPTKPESEMSKSELDLWRRQRIIIRKRIYMTPIEAQPFIFQTIGGALTSFLDKTSDRLRACLEE